MIIQIIQVSVQKTGGAAAPPVMGYDFCQTLLRPYIFNLGDLNDAIRTCLIQIIHKFVLSIITRC